MRKNKLVTAVLRGLISAIAFAIVACSLASEDGPAALIYPAFPLTTLYVGTATPYETVNTIPITVTNGIAGGIPNTPMVSVKICVPGTATCTVINNILLDTGSAGLRIFDSLINHTTLPIPAAEYGVGTGNTYQECVEYADGSSTSGTVYLADVNLGSGASPAPVLLTGQTAPSVPIQLIDSTDCSGNASNPNSFGSNGILGVRILPLDCGLTGCESPAYTIQGIQINPVATANQLINPIVMMAQDNNGFLITMPTVPAGGAAGVTGTLTMGIGTQANNMPAAAPVPTVFASDGLGFIQSTLKAQLSTTIIDSGSSVLFLPLADFASAAPDYPTPCVGPLAGLFCPAGGTQVYALTVASAAGLNPTAVNLTVENALTINYGSGPNTAFSTVGGDSGGNSTNGNTLLLGLPFFFGKIIHFAIDTRVTPQSTGPYNAF